jgi:DNA modification methylase
MGRGQRRRRRPTETSEFGSSRRESHDASPFYSRFKPPDISDDESISQPTVVDEIRHQDSRDMGDVASNSVALVVTSPPYFAGKEYERSLGTDGVPASYFEYLDLLEAVFSECKRVLEPGGRIAVNVANLGRRPYRSLSSDVAVLLERLGFLPRGEVIWCKGRRASGSCAWGTFAHPSNPVLRDVTERIVVASKGRFDRAIRPSRRARLGLPAVATITRDEFLEATTDLWEIPPESATKVGHPAPFPVELPMRLIELYTYEGDLVLDPFVGSGSTAVAAVRTKRRYLGFDTDESYVELARRRVAAEVAASPNGAGSTSLRRQPAGSSVLAAAKELIEDAGFCDVIPKPKLAPTGIEVDFLAADRLSRRWAFRVAGSFSHASAGLRKKESLLEAVATGSILQLGLEEEEEEGISFVVITTELPSPGSHLRRILDTVVGHKKPIRDVILLGDDRDRDRLVGYALGVK